MSEKKKKTTSSILVVDDDRQIRNLVGQILTRDGYRCETAADAKQAKVLLNQQRFDLMLCDIRMPGESGLQLVADVHKGHPDTAVVMFTGIDDLSVARKAIELDVYGYMVKPVDPNQIRIGVSNALRRRELELRDKAVQARLEQMVRQRTAELEAANKELVGSKAELELRAEELKDLNATLRVLLKKREEDQAEIEENLLANVKKIVQPSLQRIRKSGKLNEERISEIESLEAALDKLISPFAKRLTSSHFSLTPTELQVADLIQQGKTTKEIAAVLNLSVNTIMTHRYKIRTKLGLKQSSRNLRGYLSSLREK